MENSLINKDNEIPQTIAKAKKQFIQLAISSAEAERGFSKMNKIIVDNRASLTILNISNLMTISLTGLPLDIWDHLPFVKSWLKKHNSADDTRVKTPKEKITIPFTKLGNIYLEISELLSFIIKLS